MWVVQRQQEGIRQDSTRHKGKVREFIGGEAIMPGRKEGVQLEREGGKIDAMINGRNDALEPMQEYLSNA